MPSALHFPFRDLLAAEVIREIESDAALNDDAALSAAAAVTTDRAGRIVQRARHLEATLGLDEAIAALARRAARGGLLLAVLGTLLAMLVAGSLLGHGRSINVLGAIALLIAPNAIGMLLWTFAVLRRGRGGRGLFGSAVAALTRRWMRDGPEARTLDAASRLLDRHGLTAWVIGGLNHALWAVAYVVAAGLVLLAFAFAEYRLGWETTILEPATLQRIVHALGTLPGALGLPAVDAPLDTSDAARRSMVLAWWLISGVLVYGALPRVLLAAVAFIQWRRRSGRLELSLADPYHRALINRFDALAPTQVVDVEQPHAVAPAAAGAPVDAPHGYAVVSFELPQELPAPQQLLAGAAWHARVDGALAERRAAVERLAAQPPQRLVVVCHAASTPDRGTGRFLEPLRTVPTALLLAPAERAGAAIARWRDWLASLGRDDIGVFADEHEALRWSLAGDG